MRPEFVLVLIAILFFASTVQAALYSPQDGVVELTDANFDKLVTKSNEVWVVQVYGNNCGHCHQFKDAYAAAAKAMAGIAKFGVVEGNTNGNIAQKLQIQGFPTVKIFGANKSTPIDYNGQRDSKSVVQAAMKEIREVVAARLNGTAPKDANTTTTKPSEKKQSTNAGGKVIELKSTNFKSEVLQSSNVWIVLFKAAYCGWCKKFAGPYTDAAKQFSPTSPVRFGQVECPDNQSLCGDYKITGYPTVKIFIDGKMQDYNGARETEAVVAHMRQLEGKAKPTPKPIELINQGQFDQCIADTICIFASLPDIRDSNVEERKRYIQILTDAAVKNKQYGISWVYSFAREHRELENSLNMGQNGFPSIVLIHQGKGIYSPLYRAFTLENISDWAKQAGSNTVTSAIPFKSLPALATGVQLWDGKEYTPKDEL